MPNQSLVFQQKLLVIHQQQANLYPEFQKLISSYFDPLSTPIDIYVHASLFKSNIFSCHKKIPQLTYYQSSGTSGNPSQIFFSREESIIHQRHLLTTIRNFQQISPSSVFLQINPQQLNNNANKAASRGFSLLAKKRFTLPEEPEQIIEVLTKVSKAYEQIIIFGFTYELYEFINKLSDSFGACFDHTSFVFLHGGGWKKMYNLNITNNDLVKKIRRTFPDSAILNYYGMIEQIGNVYPMCEHENHHCDNSNDIVIRNSYGQNVGMNSTGLIQSISLLPRSYPGHSLLTEDLGIITGINSCPCGRPGKTFKVLGRIEKAEIKGCSDAY